MASKSKMTAVVHWVENGRLPTPSAVSGTASKTNWFCCLLRSENSEQRNSLEKASRKMPAEQAAEILKKFTLSVTASPVFTLRRFQTLSIAIWVAFRKNADSDIQICQFRRERAQHMWGDGKIERICNCSPAVRAMPTNFGWACQPILKFSKIENAFFYCHHHLLLRLTLILTQECEKNARFGFRNFGISDSEFILFWFLWWRLEEPLPIAGSLTLRGVKFYLVSRVLLCLGWCLKSFEVSQTAKNFAWREVDPKSRPKLGSLLSRPASPVFPVKRS